MKIKDTFFLTFIIWILTLNKNDRLKYLVFMVFLVWMILKIIKFRISKKEN
jgi:L-asparagine transporter-like permease